MAGGGGGSGSGGSTTGGQFLLQLLQKPHHQQQHLQQQQQQQRELINGGGSSAAPHRPHHDPAVAAMGPTLPLPYPWLPPSSSSSLKPQEQLNPWSSQPLNPTTYYPSPNAFIPELNYNIWAQPPASFPTASPAASPAIFADQPRQHHGVLSSTGGGGGINGNPDGRNQKQSNSQNQKQENMLMFGSLVCEIENPNGRNSWDAKNQRLDKEITMKFNNGQKKIVQALEVNGRVDGLGEFHDRRVNSHGFRQQQVAMEREAVVEEPRRAAAAAGPPGFSQRSKGKEIEQNVGQDGHGYGKHSIPKRQEPTFGGIEGNVSSSRLGLVRQLDHPGPPVGSNLHSAPALEIEESLARIHGRDEGSRRSELRREENGDEEGGSAFEEEDLLEHFGDSLVLRDEFGQKSRERRHGDAFNKDSRSNRSRQPQGIGQQRKNFRRQVQCRMDIQKFTAPFLAIYESLVPSEEEKAKQKQLLTLLEKLVNKEWPRAQLFLYGSCANSFGVSNSDIDVCLAIDDVDVDKSEVLLRLADILQSDNLQEVQALTHARVPIVKLMDPVTGISCDICINNLLAVVNTKLLRDYGRIDGRLRQLAFLVKHWAKLRGVNITYQGTLSSYAYVIMCIHFLQQRRPAILPCLQEMTATYVVKVDDMECAYFDRVDLLHDFGKPNKESIAQLMWAFFDYWAYRHDYAKDVISVRTGSMISKHEKDWTRRIGRDRHLICIEDPFETSHDLGRVVDKYSIKVLREEFERAADILQYDPDPCVTLFEPYVPAS